MGKTIAWCWAASSSPPKLTATVSSAASSEGGQRQQRSNVQPQLLMSSLRRSEVVIRLSNNKSATAAPPIAAGEGWRRFQPSACGTAHSGWHQERLLDAVYAASVGEVCRNNVSLEYSPKRRRPNGR